MDDELFTPWQAFLLAFVASMLSVAVYISFDYVHNCSLQKPVVLDIIKQLN